jgi:hypothetical protein
MLTASFGIYAKVPVEVVLLSETRLLFELDLSLKVSELFIQLENIDDPSLFHELKLILKEIEFDSKHDVSYYAHQTLYAVMFLSWDKCNDKLKVMLRDG